MTDCYFCSQIYSLSHEVKHPVVTQFIASMAFPTSETLCSCFRMYNNKVSSKNLEVKNIKNYFIDELAENFIL